MKAAKPFLKWVGGKSQLIKTLSQYYPPEFPEGTINHYVEPFLGGGAVFFDIFSRYHPKSALLLDISEELILTYKVVQRDVDQLIEYLYSFSRDYRVLDEEARSTYFYEMRSTYNQQRYSLDYRHYSDKWILRGAQNIFLNKTCYNGLFRFNSKGAFNAPKGRYKSPVILNEDNLRSVSEALGSAEIRRADFSEISKLVWKDSFVYFDPPYRPLNQTSNFTFYHRKTFSEEDQYRLADLFIDLNRRGIREMLSNSDPKNFDPGDTFFDELYDGFTIRRVPASRRINSNAKNRGNVNEIIVTNY